MSPNRLSRQSQIVYRTDAILYTEAMPACILLVREDLEAEMSDVLPTPGYLPRIAEGRIDRGLGVMGAVVVEGPRACGKTWTSRQFARSEVRFDGSEEQRLSFALSPASTLDGERPRLLDEWHLVPGTWNAVRRACDTHAERGLFILTGSAVPPDDVTRHSGAGRVRRVRMRPMSLRETGASTGQVSLASLMDGGQVSAAKPGQTFDEIVELTVTGGWPGLLGRSAGDAAEYLLSYLDEIARTDVPLVDTVRRDPVGVSRLLRSLARNVSSEVGASTLADDAQLSRHSVRDYLKALERLFIVEDVPAWQPRLMSRVPLRQAPKRFFVDPSLAAAALEAGPQKLKSDLGYFGLLFENLVARDLAVYAEANGCTVHHYRDKTGLEVDAIIQRRADGAWMAVEVKLGGADGVDAAAASLLRLRDAVDVNKVGRPAKLLVMTATGYGYERRDGVAVAPVTALCP